MRPIFATTPTTSPALLITALSFSHHRMSPVTVAEEAATTVVASTAGATTAEATTAEATTVAAMTVEVTTVGAMTVEAMTVEAMMAAVEEMILVPPLMAT